MFYRWQGTNITDRNWRPMGIAFQADPRCGEEAGAIRSPFVLKIGSEYNLFYGAVVNGPGSLSKICRATSTDGKTFTRVLNADGLSGLFTEGDNSLIRDPMVIRIGDDFHCYYCDTPQRKKGYINLLPHIDGLEDVERCQESFIGGVAGTGFTSSECPFVINHDGWYYLFRTQGYPAPTRIYRSKDPMNFGINDDQFLLGTLPLAAPEIIEHEGQTYIASLLPSLKGIRIAKLEWGTTKETR